MKRTKEQLEKHRKTNNEYYQRNKERLKKEKYENYHNNKDFRERIIKNNIDFHNNNKERRKEQSAKSRTKQRKIVDITQTLYIIFIYLCIFFLFND